MADLNEAYSVLSDAAQRREYNERLRLLGLITGTRTKTSATATATVEVTATHQTVTGTVTATKTGHAGRVSSAAKTDENFVAQLSDFLWNKILAAGGEFSWKETVFEGFDRGVEATSWSECYCVALRGFATLDAATVKKFLNYASFAVAHHKRQLRTTHFAFLLVFQRAHEWESVANQCQAFAPQASSNIVLVDMRRGQIRRFGAPFHSKRFEQLVQSLRISA